MHGPYAVGRLLLLAATAALIVAFTSLLGPTGLNLREILGGDSGSVYWRLRVPRTVLAAAAGAGLALGGVVFQSLFRNPLATPYTLGIASGASFAAAIGFLAGVHGRWLGWIPAHALLAFAGAVTAMSLVFAMARLRSGRDMTRMLLAGVCIAYLGAAGIVLVTYLADRTVTNEIVKWMMGTLIAVNIRPSVEIGVALLPAVGYAIWSHRALDLLVLGEEVAASRGVSVGRTIWVCFGMIGLLTAVIVANCGPIGFVGLIVPHIARAFVGPRTLPLIISSTALGAAFLCVCDGVGRALLAYELPVGVITNILGASFFFYLLATRDVTYVSSR